MLSGRDIQRRRARPKVRSAGCRSLAGRRQAKETEQRDPVSIQRRNVTRAAFSAGQQGLAASTADAATLSRATKRARSKGGLPIVKGCGETRLTDAVHAEKCGNQLYESAGQGFDCRSKAGFLLATVGFAPVRDDLRDELSRCLRDSTPQMVATTNVKH